MIEQMRTKASIIEMTKFLAVGVLNTIIGLSFIFFFMKIVGFNYVLSNVLAYAIALINSFFWNKRWTFQAQNALAIREVLLFLTVFFISYAFQLISLIAMKELLQVNVDLAQILSIGVYTSINYLGNRTITFSRGREL